MLPLTVGLLLGVAD